MIRGMKQSIDCDVVEDAQCSPAHEQAVDSEHLRVRADLLRLINARIDGLEWTQIQIAKALGTNQPTVSLLRNGHHERFRLDYLFKLAGRLGMELEVVEVGC